ncbi:unnamed protein product [Adineta ricciae]|uniref:Uncharacterized protein n=1 Tax=Adineta ricciae TaxID=249248 RepID=A0A816H5T9_ADIRI|nr:unnamed protein product [Adineta ricciae]
MKPIFSVPGVYHGCYIIDALFRSTLECFYDKQCVGKVQSYVESLVLFRPRVLDASLKIMKQKIGVVYIVTATIGLIGGLFTALKIVVPNLVKFIDYLVRRCAIRKMNPQISIESIRR